MKKNEIQMRDPFVLPVEKEGLYYLFGTTDKDCWRGPAVGFDVYVSKNLDDWDGPYPAFRPSADFWSDQNYWAPEVFAYQGKYYMFASFKAEGVCRGTQILIANHPKGPFVPHSDGPVTPRDWECLDGTLFVDEAGDPWMIFCHEWVQVADGEIHAIRLKHDLSEAIGEPHFLFKASEAPWAKGAKRNFNGVEKDIYVTDGPFLYRTKSGKLLMLWSSRGGQGYAMGIASSETGNILGPWTQSDQPIYGKDGGHGMFFKTFDGRLMMTIHTPNKSPNERPVFIEIVEENDELKVKE